MFVQIVSKVSDTFLPQHINHPVVKISYYNKQTTSLSLDPFWTGKAKRFGNEIKNVQFSCVCFTIDVTWYHESTSITRMQQKYSARYFKRPPTRSSILLWVKSFNKQCSVEIMRKFGNPSTSIEHKWNVSKYDNKYPTSRYREQKLIYKHCTSSFNIY